MEELRTLYFDEAGQLIDADQCHCQNQKPLNGMFNRRFSKGARVALITGGFALTGWLLAKKFAPKEFIVLGYLAGNVVGSMVSELFEDEEFFQT